MDRVREEQKDKEKVRETRMEKVEKEDELKLNYGSTPEHEPQIEKNGKRKEKRERKKASANNSISWSYY